MSTYVFHAAFEDALTLVAKVDNDSQNVAYELTNSIEHAWFDMDEINGDVLTVFGLDKVEGYRSTSIGDFMVVQGETFVVAPFGFHKILNGGIYTVHVDLGAGKILLPMTGYSLSKILNILIVEQSA